MDCWGIKDCIGKRFGKALGARRGSREPLLSKTPPGASWMEGKALEKLGIARCHLIPGRRSGSGVNLGVWDQW